MIFSRRARTEGFITPEAAIVSVRILPVLTQGMVIHEVSIAVRAISGVISHRNTHLRRHESFVNA
jgi:hypothetical protein